MRVLKIAMFATVIAGLSFIYHFERKPDPVEAPQVAIEATPIHRRTTTADLQSGQHASVKKTSAGMRKKFEEASNYAAFIHDAMQRPEEGGRFYALVAYYRCSEILTVFISPEAKIIGKPELRETATKIVDDLKKKCSGVKDYFPDQLTFLMAMKSANSKGTPDVLLIERGLISMVKKEAFSDDIKHAIESDDPYLIAATLDLNIGFLAEKLDREYANGKNRDVLYMASAAATCEIVGDCKDNYRVMATCFAFGDCTQTDYRDYLRDSIDPESRKLFDKTKSAIVAIAGRRAQPL